MYSVKVELKFSAAHRLRGYRGKCEALHGHNWKVEAEVRGEKLDSSGMLVDFSLLKNALTRVLSGLDHSYLNALPAFKKLNPTSENITRYIYRRLKREVRGLSCVTVWENDSCRARYEE